MRKEKSTPMIAHRWFARRTLNAAARGPRPLARLRTGRASRWAPLLLALALLGVAQAQSPFNYSYNPDGTINLLPPYTGPGGVLIIPNTIGGATVGTIGVGAFRGDTSLTAVTIPNTVYSIETNAFDYCSGLASVTIGNGVTNIEDSAFSVCSSLTTVTIPSGVTWLGDGAFQFCSSLTNFLFEGNAPAVSPDAFDGDTAIVYYLPGTTGWLSTLAGLTTKLLSAPVQLDIAAFGVRTNQFGFTITGTSNLVVVVEASTSLVNPTWQALQTNTLAGGSSYFSDPKWKSYPTRFYRLRLQ